LRSNSPGVGLGRNQFNVSVTLWSARPGGSRAKQLHVPSPIASPTLLANERN
jgi:hypothetical protein